MSDFQAGPGWWQASDGRWYAPEQHPDRQLVPQPAAVLTPSPPQAFPSASVPAAQAPAPGYAPSASAASGGDPTLPPGVTVAGPFGRLGSYFLESILVFLTLGIGWIIWAALIAGTGQTPAKKVLGYRVISADTIRPVGMGRMFWMRGLIAGLVAAIAIPISLGILLLMPFWDRRNQNIWDKVSNCYVVKDPNDAWATRPRLS